MPRYLYFFITCLLTGSTLLLVKTFIYLFIFFRFFMSATDPPPSISSIFLFSLPHTFYLPSFSFWHLRSHTFINHSFQRITSLSQKKKNHFSHSKTIHFSLEFRLPQGLFTGLETRSESFSTSFWFPMFHCAIYSPLVGRWWRSPSPFFASPFQSTVPTL